MKKGKLIVLDGTDGSGKTTQVELLKKRIKQEGMAVKVVDFPEYYKNFFGAFIGHCLSEQYYNFLNVHPKIASILYAVDRFESSGKIEKWLKQGKIVICNRYVSANQIHQGGKIKNIKKRNDFIKWLDKMEYEVFKIPKPDIILYLSLPINIVLKLLKNRESSKMKREYLKKKKDVHENDVNFLINSRKSALKLVKEIPNFIKIECSKNNEILSKKIIAEKIWQTLKGKIK
ncbi:dTMP kinase [Candidatus Kuenenbacteria bacterium HGW-Kuenenbacteria-1]|uniref:Thymidylate kinase n=1 Tax=Candidatus Kuenenbacteria bacterium HGW-Kuenenbacteria-1 TaxID=2013812 RepID=A0A2N1UNS5_9BACT|nr:MAG: dTMP kinase [Candidatus Kuenenbacteria bacterium HGW-Kuenenbacteria-1]